MTLEKVGKVFASGFGDRVLIGAVIGALKKTTPLRCYEYIRDKRPLLSEVSDREWRGFKRLAKQVDLDGLTRERIIAELEKYRLDLLSVIINHPEGLNWLEAQITDLKKKVRAE